MLKRLDSKHCVKLIEAKLAELTIIGNNLNHIFQHDNYWPIIVL